ncbi:unnamed protein product [Symbiodinium sp. CCMP2592]|nr:unnamed protein product [Symbiodinium sp. CCMP2592]CAE7330702.1 unnamed protein product [Symbiodinium sp. CCMP2592]
MGWGHVASTLCEAQGESGHAGHASRWAVVAEDVCLSQESSDSLMEEADALCENSDDDTLLIPEPRPGYADKSWWARQLEQHALALGYKVSADSAKPLQLELGIPFRCLSTSEPDSDFRSFQAANHTIEQQFTSLQMQVSAHESSLRQSRSSERSADVDLLVCGSPCNPFSRMRGKRFHQDSVMSHKSYATTFVDVFKAFEAFEPKTAVMEQTAGFGLPFDCSTSETPLQRFIDGFGECKFTKGGYWIVVIKCELSIWVKLARSRLDIRSVVQFDWNSSAFLLYY